LNRLLNYEQKKCEKIEDYSKARQMKLKFE